MFRWFFETNGNPSLFFTRLALGIVVLPHGMQKVFGLWGGQGFWGTIASFEKVAGFPMGMTILLMAIEFLGSLGLILGFCTRLAAFGIGTSMTVCALMGHIQNGFFMNWSGTQKGEGFEYHILVLGIALALMIGGGGLWSLDRAISRFWVRLK